MQQIPFEGEIKTFEAEIINVKFKLFKLEITVKLLDDIVFEFKSTPLGLNFCVEYDLRHEIIERSKVLW